MAPALWGGKKRRSSNPLADEALAALSPTFAIDAVNHRPSGTHVTQVVACGAPAEWVAPPDGDWSNVRNRRSPSPGTRRGYEFHELALFAVHGLATEQRVTAGWEHEYGVPVMPTSVAAHQPAWSSARREEVTATVTQSDPHAPRSA
jgi:hypothetical protein